MTTDPSAAAEEAPQDGWDAARGVQLDAWATTTPAQRLAWLEEAIRFAHRAGALPRQHRDRPPTGDA